MDNADFLESFTNIVSMRRESILKSIPDYLIDDDIAYIRSNYKNEPILLLPLYFKDIYDDISTQKLGELCVASGLMLDYSLTIDRMHDQKNFSRNYFFVSQFILIALGDILDEASVKSSFINRLLVYHHENKRESENLSEYSYDGYKRSSIAKAALAQILIDKLGNISNREVNKDPLVSFLNIFIFMTQLRDDIKDWDKDIISQRSYLQKYFFIKGGNLYSLVELIISNINLEIDIIATDLFFHFGKSAMSLVSLLRLYSQFVSNTAAERLNSMKFSSSDLCISEAK